MLSWYYFRRYIFSKKSGSLVKTISRLSVLGVGMGVFSFIFVLSVMNGFNDNIKNRVLAVEPHLVVQSEIFKSAEQIISTPVYKKLQKLRGNETFIFENQDVILRTTDGIYHGAVARGLPERSLSDMFARLQKQKKQGESFLWEDNGVSLGEGQVIIGVDLAHRLGVLEGDVLTVIPPEVLLLPPGEIPHLEKVTIQKIVTTNVADIDEKLLFYQIGQGLYTFQDSPSRYFGLEIWLQDEQQVEDYKSLLGAPHLVVESWQDRNSSLFFALKLEKLVIGLFLFLSGLIAVCSVITLVLLLVSQKRREIGVMMAFGMSPRVVTKIFGNMGFFLSLIGIASGLVLALLAIWLLKTYPIDILPGIYYESQIPVRLDFVLIGVVIFVSVLLAFISGWLPARRLSTFNPSRVIRNQG